MACVGGSDSRTWSFISDQPGRSRGYLLMIGRHACRAFELPATGELSIGRGEDADVVIEHRAVSRSHARLIAARGEVRIADLGSHNGTTVNGVAVDGSRVLASGDEIAIGDAVLVVHLPRRVAVAIAGSEADA